MKALRSLLLAALLLGLAAAPVSASVTFGQPTAEAVLGSPISFRTSLSAAGQPERVELLLSAPRQRSSNVLPATLTAEAGGWTASAVLEARLPPNTRFEYRFRVRADDGTVHLGPPAEVVVVDERFAWRTIEGEIIRLHWYAGDEAFARRAIEIGERAVANASELLGVQETEPIDFFIYDSDPALREALGPGTRENVGGQAHADIRTLFGLITPAEVDSGWVDTLVAHELTHLVFDTATENPYHRPPRWLNEGVAVYLSEGYSATWRATVEAAVGRGTLIPLDGLGGLFPTTAEQFRLAYGESVAAVDFFIRTYGESTLWQLVRSYAEGVSDDEAFEAATGADLADFNAAWFESLGVEVPEPVGPLGGPAGPLPPGWDGAGATPRPTSPTDGPLGPTSDPGAATARPGAPPPDGPDHPTAPGSPAGRGDDSVLLGLGVGVVVVLGIVGLALIARRRLLT